MADKIEGTVVLDGLLEARMGDLVDGEQALRRWRDRAEQAGLIFSLEIQHDSFSILADSHPLQAEKLGDVTETIRRCLQELIDLFPDRAGMLSTIRSVEYQPGLAVQTLYTIAPDGNVAARSRTIDSKTTPPPQPIPVKRKIRLALAGLAIAVVLLLLSSFILPYGEYYRQIVGRFIPLDVSAVEVDAGAFDRYFTVPERRKAAQPHRLVLTLQRTKDYPLTPADQDKLATDESSLRKRLALEAVVRGYLRCELFDSEGKYLDTVLVRIAPLREKEKMELSLPLRYDYKLGKVLFTY